jgi:hypothetical protein
MQGGWQPPPGGGSGYGAPPGYTQPAAPYGGGPPSMGQNPYAAPGAPMGAYQGYGQYEFNDMENQIIDKTAARAKLWGWISAVIGALQLFGGTCGSLANAGMAVYVPYGIVMLIVGITFIGVGNSLRMVVQTQGNDIAHMMQALQKLGNAFFIQAIAFIVMVVLVAVISVLVFFVLIAAAASR